MTDSRFALDGLTKNLPDWERKGWIAVSHAKLFKTTTAWLRYRSGPTKLQWVKGHSGTEGNNEADKLAGSGAEQPHPKEDIDHSVPHHLTLSGAELKHMTQKMLYKGIKSRKKREMRKTTN